MSMKPSIMAEFLESAEGDPMIRFFKDPEFVRAEMIILTAAIIPCTPYCSSNPIFWAMSMRQWLKHWKIWMRSCFQRRIIKAA